MDKITNNTTNRYNTTIILLLQYSNKQKVHMQQRTKKQRHIKESQLYRAIKYSTEAVSFCCQGESTYYFKERSRSYNYRRILYHFVAMPFWLL